jgi:outer membrane protein assembly factor BamB
MDRSADSAAARLHALLSRRRLVAASGVAAVTAGITAQRLLAQEATPDTEDDAVGDSSAQEATPTSDLPAVPPEFLEPTNWPVEGLDLQMTRNVQGSSIDSASVSQLGLAWSVPVSVPAAFGALTANPIVVGDLVYLQDAAANVYAFNKETGEQVWYNEYNDVVPSGGPNGVAVGYGLAVYTVGGVGDVVAVMADTGEEAWRTNIRGPLGEGITIAPLIHDSTVYVSTIPGSSEAFYLGGMRGLIFALDLLNGEVIWYFDTTTENLWGNARVNSGGGLWHPPSVDDEGNLYVGIANASPYPGTEEFPGASSRPGPNDYANALMRIDPETASYDWYINVKPHDLFDHDNQLSPILATVPVDGSDVPMVFSSGKHGWVVAANAETGEELWRTAVGDHNENEFLQDLGAEEEIELLPGFIGGVETPMAYGNGVIYAPVLNVPFTTTGVEGTGDIFGGVGELVALDAATGEITWTVDIPTMVLGGATLVNDLVFTGGLDGLVRGFRIDDGTEVFTYQCPAGINASFAVSGEYLFVPAGGPLSPSVDTAEPAPETSTEFIALRIGGEVQATPAAGATPEA